MQRRHRRLRRGALSVDAPSRGRVWLGGVVDMLLFGCVFSFLVWPLGNVAPWATSQLVRLGAFVVVWLLTVRLTGTSPGAMVLGQRRGEDGWEFTDDPPERETRWTLAAGLLMVWSGYSSLTHIADGLPPRPFFGEILPPVAGYLAVSVIGAIHVGCGILVLRGRGLGAVVSLAVTVIESLGSLVRPEATDAWLEQMVITRRALQGIPVREGEVAFVQAWAALWSWAFLLLVVPWLLLVYRRLRDDD